MGFWFAPRIEPCHKREREARDRATSQRETRERERERERGRERETREKERAKERKRENRESGALPAQPPPSWVGALARAPATATGSKPPTVDRKEKVTSGD
jgi:hypothetical protein